jgi:hypothetical protein
MFVTLLLSLLFAGNMSATNRNPVADFDGDGKTDISVFRPSDGYWYISKSSGGYLFVPWGLATDTIVPGDYDGDGKTDLAVYRLGPKTPQFGNITDNTWYILRSSDNTLFARQFGKNGQFEVDTPLPADYDGDRKTDLGLYTQSDHLGSPSYFTVLQSLSNLRLHTRWGFTTDRRVPEDYDGDGKVDYAVFRGGIYSSPTEQNIWYILQSSDSKVRIEYFGLPTDRLVPADYDGDGEADIAVWRPSNGYWYWISSSDKSFNSIQFGISEDKPVPGDYDGDGKTDVAVFRPSNRTWYIQQSTKGFRAEQFGLSADIPIPSVFVRSNYFD